MEENDPIKELCKKYLPKFLEELNEHCVLFKMIGMGSFESPKWFQYRGKENGKLVFKSSQTDNIWFAIDLEEKDVEQITHEDYDEIYLYFRAAKYAYIKEHHPTIK